MLLTKLTLSTLVYCLPCVFSFTGIWVKERRKDQKINGEKLHALLPVIPCAQKVLLHLLQREKVALYDLLLNPVASTFFYATQIFFTSLSLTVYCNLP